MGLLDSCKKLAKAGVSLVGTNVDRLTEKVEKMSDKITVSLDSVNVNAVKASATQGSELVVLPKGGNVKIDDGIQVIAVGLGWNPSKKPDEQFDLDASMFLIGEDGKLASEGLVYYGHKQLDEAPQAIKHSGDNLTGEGAGDDEVILVQTSCIPDSVHKIDIIANIYEAQARRQNFGQVSDAYVRLYDIKTGEVFVRYDLSEDYSTDGSVIVAQLYRNNGSWKFKAIGEGVKVADASLTSQKARYR